MNYKEFKQVLSKNDLKGAYLFFGQETLVIERTIEYIVSSYLEPSFKELNLTQIHGSNLNLKDFYGYIETLPFMSKKRVVIIDELADFLQKIDINDDFTKTIENLSKETILIFFDSDQNLKKTSKFYKLLKKLNKDIEFTKLDNSDLFRFLMKEIKSHGKIINESDLSYFIMLSGYLNKKLEVGLLETVSELEKIIAYSKNKEISRNDINETIKKSSDVNIFTLLDAISNKDALLSLTSLHDLYDKNESMQGILHMIQRRYRHLYEYAALEKINKGEAYIKNIISISDYEFKQVGKIARRYSPCSLKEKLELILDVDIKLKSTATNQLLMMEYLITKLCI